MCKTCKLQKALKLQDGCHILHFKDTNRTAIKSIGDNKKYILMHSTVGLSLNITKLIMENPRWPPLNHMSLKYG